MVLINLQSDFSGFSIYLYIKTTL